MSGMSGLIFARRLKTGRWRLYEVEDRAIMAWRGSNSVAHVMHDPVTGAIVSFETMTAAERWLRDHMWEFDGEWPKCKMCGYYYRLAESAHQSSKDCLAANKFLQRTAELEAVYAVNK